MTLKDVLKNELKNNIKKLYSIEIDPPLLYPEYNFGDYSTTIAMSLAKSLRKNPKIIANEIVDCFTNSDILKKVEIAGNGYINFFLKDELIKDIIRNKILDNYTICNDITPVYKKVMLEYVSANPTGPLHIGHGRWAAIGDSISRIFKATNTIVHNEFYINDTGNQIDLLHKSVEAVKNNSPIPENGYHGEYIKELARYDRNPEDILLEEQKETLKKFRCSFDCFFSEKTLHNNKEVDNTINLLKANNIAYEKDGALWFKTTDYGDDKDRVLIKSDGSKTYFAVDIAYHKSKLERFSTYDLFVNILGADHHGYLPRITAAMKNLINLLNINKNIEFKVIIGQLVNLYRNGEPVRMSKRTGDMITLNEVIDEIGVDATRYYLVSKKTDTSIDFDIELAKKKSDENPVYYVQYAHARICSILKNINELNKNSPNLDIYMETETSREIALELIKFPEIINEAAINLEPHRIVQYLENLATLFHRFYNETRVISDDKVQTMIKVNLLKAIKIILSNALYLIGVSAPEEM